MKGVDYNHKEKPPEVEFKCQVLYFITVSNKVKNDKPD